MDEICDCQLPFICLYPKKKKNKFKGIKFGWIQSHSISDSIRQVFRSMQVDKHFMKFDIYGWGFLLLLLLVCSRPTVLNIYVTKIAFRCNLLHKNIRIAIEIVVVVVVVSICICVSEPDPCVMHVRKIDKT